MGRNRGRAAGAALVLAALPWLGGCTPEDKPMLAVDLAGGRPTLLIVNCSDFKIDSVNLHGAAGQVWRIRTRTDPGPESITLLETPAGWTATEATLTDFEPGVQYQITAFPDGNGGTVSVPFTLDQLRALGDGEVVTGRPNTSSEVVSEKDYREDAENSC